MKNEALQIAAWGFTAAELAAWPPGLTPVVVTQGPFEGATLVHARAVKSFVAEAEAHLLADGRLAPAVLYADKEVPLEPGVFVDFAAVVDGLDNEELAQLLGCPERFAMVEYAEELPSHFLRRLVQPIAELAPEDLPLPADVVAHLRVCPTCRAGFNEAVAARARWQRLAFCPTPAQLHAFLAGAELPAVAQHLAECPQCRAEAAVLNRSMKPAWFTAPLRASTPMSSMAAQTFVAAQKTILAALMQGLLMQMQTAGAQALRRPAANGGEPDFAALVDDLLAGENLKFVREYRDLSLQLVPDQTAIEISALHGESQTPLVHFNLELWSEEDLQWSGRSQDGRLLLPLEALATALRHGAVDLVVRPGFAEETATE